MKKHIQALEARLPLQGNKREENSTEERTKKEREHPMTKTQTKRQTNMNTRSVARDVAACLIVSASVRGTSSRISR